MKARLVVNSVLNTGIAHVYNLSADPDAEVNNVGFSENSFFADLNISADSDILEEGEVYEVTFKKL